MKVLTRNPRLFDASFVSSIQHAIRHLSYGFSKKAPKYPIIGKPQFSGVCIEFIGATQLCFQPSRSNDHLNAHKKERLPRCSTNVKGVSRNKKI